RVPADPEVRDIWIEGETMRVNMGPQHPSTHGVLRLRVELAGETIVSVEPIIGYLHTGIEKTAEALNWMQVPMDVTRADYLSNFFNETAYSVAVERLAGVEPPPRAQWLRVLLCELNRVSSHLVWLATSGLELGALSMATYAFREREILLDIFQAITGTRMNHGYIRPGGLAQDLPVGADEMIRRAVTEIPARIDEYEELLTGNPIWVSRNKGIGVLEPDVAIALGVTGPMLRASGVPHDLRVAAGYLPYDRFDFDVPVGQAGDSFDRYAVRMAEMRQSLRIVEQALAGLPSGPVRAKGKLMPPPRDRINVSMEALIHHFKLYTDGPHVPEGEAYVAVESPRGELGYYVASDGRGRPWRVRIRPPSLMNLQALPRLCTGHLLADVIAVLASVDPVMGDVDR
ncbi:MAG TPA: NADH-quinone oxidoreductase subunit D, partial [Actinomycetota bacterium]|nr:NADH-quinone oxidoreductase subunit D [Actinomycetota bacterium]